MLLPDASEPLEEKQLLQRSTQTFYFSLIQLEYNIQLKLQVYTIPFACIQEAENIYKFLKSIDRSIFKKMTWIVEPNPHIY